MIHNWWQLKIQIPKNSKSIKGSTTDGYTFCTETGKRFFSNKKFITLIFRRQFFYKISNEICAAKLFSKIEGKN